MERKIGEIFEFKKDWYQCVEGRCKDCHFSEKRFLCKQFITKDFCTHGIIFKKLEKVGEPYMLEAKKFQKYRVFHTPYIYNKIDYSWQSFADPYYVSLELKQNKEDMEEKKLNLKPFDIQKAREGKPVCIRDGRKARILCYDLKGAEYPIVAAVETCNCFAESICGYDKNGRFDHDTENNNDLMMLPEKKEGWVNVYDADTTFYFVEGMVYNTKEEAIKHINHDNEIYTTTVKIEWEE